MKFVQHQEATYFWKAHIKTQCNIMKEWMSYLDKTKNIQTGQAGPTTLTRAQKEKKTYFTTFAEWASKTNSSQFTLKRG